MDYNRILEYHIEKKADITIVCKDMPVGEDVSRFGVIRMNEDSRIVEFEEKPMVAQSNTISAGIYIVRRRQLIEMLERCAEENRHDFVTDILIRYKNLKRIYGYKMEEYWSNIATVESYYRTNMDFLRPEVRKYFSNEPKIYSKVLADNGDIRLLLNMVLQNPVVIHLINTVSRRDNHIGLMALFQEINVPEHSVCRSPVPPGIV